jgi:hypothetical protein
MGLILLGDAFCVQAGKEVHLAEVGSVASQREGV